MRNKSAAKELFGLKNWLKITGAMSHLVYPESCLICDGELSSNEKSICSFCSPELEYTHFEKYTEPTDLDKLFWGRVIIEQTFSLLYFRKEQSTQRILHALKYKHSPQVGVEFGRIIGRTIKSLAFVKDLDLLIPVPLHPKKEFKNMHTRSQTRKGRFERWDNVSQVFRMGKTKLAPSHIAIIDDVITTGATLESIIRTIQQNYPDIRISIISLALTK